MVTLVVHTNCPGRLITQSKLSQLEAWCIKKAPHAVGEKIESQTNIQRFQLHSYFYFVQKRRKIWLWSAPASFASDLLINSAGYNQCWVLSKSDIAALPPVPHHTSFHISSVLTPRLSQRSSPTPPVFYLPNIPKGPRSAPWAGVVRHWWVQSKNILKNHV